MSQQHILVVEDDTSLRLVIQDILDAAGYKSYPAAHGQKALKMLEWLRADLIVSDIMMPVMDGYQFFTEVRAHPEWSHIPFIFLSARGSKLDVLAGKQLGADDYLIKPFDADELLVAVSSKLAIADRWRQVQAKELEQIKQNILRALNHEFRTPLTYITAYTEILAESGGKLGQEDFAEFCGAILKGSERLQKLIDDFLFLAQLETGEAQLTFESRRMAIEHWRSLLEDCVLAYQAEAANKGLELELSAPDNTRPVMADMVFIQNAIGRLLHNAIKFSPKGAGPITIRAFQENNRFCIAIRDCGIGIRPEELSNIFQPLHQIDRDKMEQQGSGSGLAIAHALITMHGGEIQVESSPGEGSTFCIVLPAPAGVSQHA